MKTINEISCPAAWKPMTKAQLDKVESILDKLFASLKIDIKFTRHFFDRLNDARNKKQISHCELVTMFTSLYRKFGVQIKDAAGAERLIKSMSTDINVPIAIQWNKSKGEIEIAAKTIMRKKGFKTRDKTLNVESMVSFKEFVDIKEMFLNEGGNAIANVVPIHQENVASTMEVIYKKLLPALGISKADTALLGSTGKKNPHSSSGDIDMAVSISALMASNPSAKTMPDLLNLVYAKSNNIVNEVKQLKGIGIVTIENTDGEQPDEIVQLDLMLTDNVEFASWMYFSPHQKDSPWKGLYRNSMLSAISHYADRQGNDEEWSRYLLHFNKGLGRVKESRKGKRGLLKNAKVIERETPVKNADEIVKILLGDSFKAKDILTWKNVFDAFMSSRFAWKKNRKEIAKLVVKDIVGKNYPVPKEIAKIAGV